jgi:predicted acylesterase/phospholipase RssA
VKRAITLGGGGPAAGLHIGALERLANAGITFDVWALSCIGAWVGLVNNQFDGTPSEQAEKTHASFRDGVFRNDMSYSRFPINTVFGPDLGANTDAIMKFLTNPASYQNLWLPGEFVEAWKDTVDMMTNRSRWNEGDFNHWMLDSVLAVNPWSRFATSLMFLSNVNGLSRIYYPESSFLRAIKFENLFRPDKPFLYHNAWNLSKKRMELFSNKPHDGYYNVSAQSLCACSALPFLEETVDIAGDTYCEGALVETVNFDKLLDDHPDLDEIWIVRIVDIHQVRKPRTIADGLGNLCMMFAGALGEDDVKLFTYRARELGFKGTIMDIRVATDINYEWSHSNLEHGIEDGYAAADETVNFNTFLRRYLGGDIAGAKTCARQFTNKEYQLGLVAKALVANDPDEKPALIDDLTKLDAAWSATPRAQLGKTIYNDNILDKLTRDMGWRS